MSPCLHRSCWLEQGVSCCHTQVVVLFCLYVCVYFTFFFFSYLCRVSLQAVTLSVLSITPNCWEDLPYTTVLVDFLQKQLVQ